jgi:hypothetical protein
VPEDTAILTPPFEPDDPVTVTWNCAVWPVVIVVGPLNATITLAVDEVLWQLQPTFAEPGFFVVPAWPPGNACADVTPARRRAISSTVLGRSIFGLMAYSSCTNDSVLLGSFE